MSRQRQLSLNVFVYPGGHHEAAWRYKGTDTSRLLDIRYYQELAKRAEAARFDALFFADGPVLADNIRYASRFRVEPITWLSAIASATSHIGLIATASTSYYDPYNLARLFASLDHLSGGRAGWNIVTTSVAQAAQNFGLAEHPIHADRYERGREFVEVVTKLWDSWEDDAIVADQASGIYADDAKIHAIEHIGKHFRVKGALNTPRTPQGRPVYVQAGSSEDGRSFAALYAEAIFTAHQTLSSAQSFYADIKRRAVAVGRRPEHIKVLPGLSPFIGSTQAEADRLEEEFNDLIQPEYSLHQLRRMTGIDLSGYELDGPFPRHLLPLDSAIGTASRFQLIVGILDRENLTIRQLINRLAGAERLLVLGSGLTMLDALISAERRGFRGQYTVVSRRGLLVAPRREVPAWPGTLDVAALETAGDVLRWIGQERRAIREANEDWQSLPALFRQHAGTIWARLDDHERSRLLKRLVPYWNLSQHRAAPSSYAWLERVRAEGRLRPLAGTVIRLEAAGEGIRVSLHGRGGAVTLDADVVVSALGYEFNWPRIDDPLVSRLLSRGLVVPHPVGLGIRGDRDTLRVIGADGHPSANLFAVGHAFRGELWESSSIRELLEQATRLGPALARADFPPSVATHHTTAA